jgi:hypothetical protein
MNVLRIVDRQRRPLARVAWEPPDRVDLEVLDPSCAAELAAFIEQAKRDGVPLRTGRQVEREGQVVIVDEQIVVKPDDERYLRGLADAVSSHSFGGRRAFGLLGGREEGR